MGSKTGGSSESEDVGGAGGGGGGGWDIGLDPNVGMTVGLPGMPDISTPEPTQSESAFGYGVPGSEGLIGEINANQATEAAANLDSYRGGGQGVAEGPSPRAWEEKAAETAGPKEAEKEKEKKRKRRRRSLVTEEEEGLLSTAPTYRRSILGG